MSRESSGMARGLRVILWIARISATLIVAVMAIMMVGYAVNPQGNPATSYETALLALFPIGMCRLPGCLAVGARWRYCQSSVHRRLPARAGRSRQGGSPVNPWGARHSVRPVRPAPETPRDCCSVRLTHTGRTLGRQPAAAYPKRTGLEACRR